MVRFWKSLAGQVDPDPQTIEKLQESERELADARSRTEDVNDLAAYLADRRKKNHFGDALDISFRPRRRHA